MNKDEISRELMQDSNANWSLYAAYALAEYYEQLEEDLGETLEFDSVAIRCEFSEYSSLQDWASEYGLDCIDLGVESDDDDETKAEAIQDYIEARGTLLDFNGGILVSSF